MNLALRPLNVLIGANGAGKSNFLSFFKLLQACVDGYAQLEAYVQEQGGANHLLYYGAQETKEIRSKLVFEVEKELFDLVSSLIPQEGDQLKYSLPVTVSRTPAGESIQVQATHFLEQEVLHWAVHHWAVHRFYQPDPKSSAKTLSSVHDQLTLRAEGQNIAALLYKLYQYQEDASNLHLSKAYEKIRKTIQLVAPFIEDFIFEPLRSGDITLQWKDRKSGHVFGAYQLSDGTLNFICLATLLLQPELPHLIFIDEPELGLHPYAIALLAGMLKSASVYTQLIVSTQSVTLLEQLEDPEDVVVVERENNQSTFRRLSSEDLADWLKDYSLGELWQKNLLGGRP